MSVRRTKIALIAHSGRKADMVAFATYNRDLYWVVDAGSLGRSNSTSLSTRKAMIFEACPASSTDWSRKSLAHL